MLDRALSHLFLKVKFGLTHFKEREQFVTDDPQDGGVDGYFMDEERKMIYLIQTSKEKFPFSTSKASGRKTRSH